MNKSLSFTAALASVVVTASAFAYSPKDSAPAAATPAATAKLAPTKVVKPSRLPLSFTRSIVNIEFSLDQSGHPRDIKVLSDADRAVEERIVRAFKQWKFGPVAPTAGGESKRFILPLDIVPEV